MRVQFEWNHSIPQYLWMRLYQKTPQGIYLEYFENISIFCKGICQFICHHNCRISSIDFQPLQEK